jgi:DNA-binding GntR family transcriptional regulator
MKISPGNEICMQNDHMSCNVNSYPCACAAAGRRPKPGFPDPAAPARLLPDGFRNPYAFVGIRCIKGFHCRLTVQDRGIPIPVAGGRQRIGQMAGQTEQVLKAIETAIDCGELNPGDIIEEATLMAAHDVSRTPVREAFIRLESAGLIRRLPRKGAVLFKPTLAEFLAILEVHAKLEGQAAGLAARRLSAQNAADLEAAVQACETHAAQRTDADPDGYYQLNLRFHEVVAISAGNPFLTEMIKTNARKLMAYYRARYRYPGSIAASAAEHRHIAGLITSRSRDAAEAAMLRHVQFDQVTVMDLLAALG